MILISEKWGEITYSETDKYRFEQGIPAFEHLSEFVIVPIDETPFYCMQSIEDISVSFILTNPFDFFKSYEFYLDDVVKTELSVTSEQEVVIYNIVKIDSRIEESTVNLAAPIVLHNTEKKGKQYILTDCNYKVNQPLFSPLAL